MEKEACQQQDDHSASDESHGQKGQLLLLQQKDLALGRGLEDQVAAVQGAVQALPAAVLIDCRGRLFTPSARRRRVRVSDWLPVTV